MKLTNVRSTSVWIEVERGKACQVYHKQSVFLFANLVPLERWAMGSRNKQKWEAPSEKPSEIQNSSEKGLFVFGYRGGGSWDKL